jgi:hypothetical protein
VSVPASLRGPWVAVLADRYGYVYESVSDARENVDDPDGGVAIAVVRGTALPSTAAGDCRPRLPGSWHCGDRAYELEGVYLDDPDDPSVGAADRFDQAQAMAAGLNQAAAVEEFRRVRHGDVAAGWDAELCKAAWKLAEATDRAYPKASAGPEEFRCICDPSDLFDPPDPQPRAVAGCPAHRARRAAQQFSEQHRTA